MHNCSISKRNKRALENLLCCIGSAVKHLEIGKGRLCPGEFDDPEVSSGRSPSEFHSSKRASAQNVSSYKFTMVVN